MKYIVFIVVFVIMYIIDGIEIYKYKKKFIIFNVFFILDFILVGLLLFDIKITSPTEIITNIVMFFR